MTLSQTHIEARINRCRQLLASNEIHYLIGGPGPDLAYLTSHFSHPSERPVMLVVPASGTATIVIAGFESLSLPDLDGVVEVATYSETENPYSILRAAVSFPSGEFRISISDDAWSSVLLNLQSSVPGASFCSAKPITGHARLTKDATELDSLRTAGIRADEAVERTICVQVSGFTERQIANRLKRELEDSGLTDTSSVIGSGPNGASPHHSISDRIIEEGDIVVMDCWGRYQGYFADVTRTFAVGTPRDTVGRAYEAVREAQERACDAVRPGVTTGSIDHAARSVISDAGMGLAFLHRTGHGVGLAGHEEPYVVAGNDVVLQSGMVFSIEPGVYFAGDFGIRLEDTGACTDSGFESFNHMDRGLRVIH